MKRKLSYNKYSIYNTDHLDCLKNYHEQIDELEISIPGIPIDMNKIPKSVSVLRFNYNFENLPCEIPSNIKSIYFYIFSHLLEELPNTIEHIQIHKGFNNQVDKLGNHLKSIDFGCDFNQQVDNLPTSLEKVVFNSLFTHPINNLSPNIKLVHIFNPNYDLMSIKSLPKSIILLQLGFDKDMDNDVEFDFTFNLERKKYITEPIDKNYDSQKQLYLRNIYFYNN